MTATWDIVLPLTQQINAYGGNFTSPIVNRSVIQCADRLAADGDADATASLERIRHYARTGKWPQDPDAFNGLFEAYHELLFYLLAKNRGVALGRIPESSTPTPDYRSRTSPLRFEIKTLDFSGGQSAYKKIAEDAFDRRVRAHESAKEHGAATASASISLHGKAANIKEAIERVMKQIAANIRSAQFTPEPTVLVLPLVRTALRCEAQELEPERDDHHLGGRVSGHLWTVAAHSPGEPFCDATTDEDAHSLGPLAQAGVLRDHPYVRAILFIETCWSQLPGADDFDPDVLGKAFRIFGVWNVGSRDTGAGVSPAAHPEFSALCRDGQATFSPDNAA